MKFSIVFTALVAGAALLAYAPEGAEAATLQPRSKSCKVSSDCDQSKHHFCNHGKCATMKSVGGSCYKDQGCLSGLCFNKKCISKSKRPTGASCSTSDQCKTGYCKHGTCAVKKANGHVCYKDAGCKSGYCNKHSKCSTPKSSTSSSTASSTTATTQSATTVSSVAPTTSAPAPTGVTDATTVSVMSDIEDAATTTGGATVEVVTVEGEKVASVVLPGSSTGSSFSYAADLSSSRKRSFAQLFRRDDTTTVPAIIFEGYPLAMSVSDGAPTSSTGCVITGTIDDVQVTAGEFSVSALSTGDQAQDWQQLEIQSEGSISTWSVTVTCDPYITAAIYLAKFMEGSVTETETHTTTNPSAAVDLRARAVQTSLPVARK